MTESGNAGVSGQHNLAATFEARSKAQQAADLLTEKLNRSSIRVTAKRRDAKVQYAEMRDELEGVVASPALGTAVTKSQAEGGSGGAALVGGTGLLLGALVGFIIHGSPGSEISVAQWMLTWVLVPAFAGGTLGLLAGALLKQRYAPAPYDSAPDREASPGSGIDSPEETVVEVATDDAGEFERALGLLEQLHPQRLDQFDSDGQVVSTSELGDRASD